MMKINKSIKTTISLAAMGTLVLAASSANAAVIVTQAVGWTDGNNITTSESIAFDVVNANSILVATLYIDGTANITSVLFGGAAPDATVQDDRTFSFLFLNPSTASSLSLDFIKVDTGGVAAALYEISGAATTLSSITTVTAANSIDTSTADELIVSFAGENGNARSVAVASIFTDEDLQMGNGGVGAVRGGGSLASASGTAPGIGTHNISWGSGDEGRIAYAFEAVPEPTTTALLGLGGFALILRRRK
jgi:hypothetical protein